MFIREYFLNSSIHGFHFIADRKYHLTERIFWLICIISSYYGSYLLIASVLQEFNTQTSTLSVDTTYLNWETNFPTIIYCDKGNLEQFNQYKKQEKVDKKITLSELLSIVYYRGRFHTIMDCTKGKASPFCEFQNFSKYLEQTKIKCTELFSSCFYNNKKFTCCNAFKYIPSCYGTCFAINSFITDDSLSFKISHKMLNGYTNMSIEVYYGNVYIVAISPDSVPSLINVKQALLDSDISNIVVNQNYDVHLSIKEVISDKSVEFLEPKQRGCRFTYENNLDYSKIYSLSACINECYIKMQQKFCNCTVHTYPLRTHEEECDGYGVSCIKTKESLIKKYLDQNCVCENSCSFTEIKNVGEIPDSEPEFRDPNSVLRVNFIVQAPTVRYVRQVVRNYLDLIVSVGGSLGLFIGASLLTIIEIFYYLMIRPLNSKLAIIKKKKSKGSKKAPFIFVN